MCYKNAIYVVEFNTHKKREDRGAFQVIMCSVIIVFSWWIRNSRAFKENLMVYANKLDTSHWKHSRVTNQDSNKPTAAEHWSCKPQNGEEKTKMSSGRQQCTRLHGAQPTHRKPADLFLTPKSSHVFAGSSLVMLCQISCKNWYPNDNNGFDQDI